ncbi:MAG: cysteine desulfurase family protein [Phycisphaerales bacterium JB040]
MRPVYLDHNATTRPSPGVADAVRRGVEDLWGNPSSVHRAGQDARAGVELARASLARLIGAREREIVFTSSCTEAIDLGVRGSLEALGDRRPALVTSPVEHAAIRELADDLARRGTEVRELPVRRAGVYDLDAAREIIDGSVGVVAVQLANNETGVLQPVEELGRLCARAGAVLLADGAQWVGKLPLDVRDETGPASGVGLLAISGHKFHAPKGVGALWIRRGVRVRPRLLGTHELGRRGGTENVPGILGLGVASDEARGWLADPARRAGIASLRDRLERLVLDRVPDAVINRPPDDGDRLWNTTSIGFPGLEAETILIPLSERGVYASAGAACSSGSLEPSPVLRAMGIPDRVAHGSIRLSLGRDTTPDDVERGAEVIAGVVASLAGAG